MKEGEKGSGFRGFRGVGFRAPGYRLGGHKATCLGTVGDEGVGL